jgi:hypothetical protein
MTFTQIGRLGAGGGRALNLSAGSVRLHRRGGWEAREGAEAAEHPERKRDQPRAEQRNAGRHCGSHQPVPCLAVCREDRPSRMLFRDLFHTLPRLEGPIPF